MVVLPMQVRLFQHPFSHAQNSCKHTGVFRRSMCHLMKATRSYDCFESLSHTCSLSCTNICWPTAYVQLSELCCSWMPERTFFTLPTSYKLKPRNRSQEYSRLYLQTIPQTTNHDRILGSKSSSYKAPVQSTEPLMEPRIRQYSIH